MTKPTGITINDLALIRVAILSVVDRGCPWLLYAADEALANQERLDFCDAVANYITDRAKINKPETYRVADKETNEQNNLSR